ncbi:hypothetical protein BVC80_9081g29 [Macleaya cordata]|uniref:Uncharacterized protein n=1 Tax=Macleaya cordata TaxID=56857 RepID=A0A200PRM8_MACCD|nr:hypothetical protein BVC80_9081g29 [Macleaya cordata]
MKPTTGKSSNIFTAFLTELVVKLPENDLQHQPRGIIFEPTIITDINSSIAMVVRLYLLVYKLSIGAACGLSWSSDRIIIQDLDNSTNPTIKPEQKKNKKLF